MWTRLAGLIVKESIQFLRDRVMLILILWLYTVEAVICTLALSFEVKDMPLATVDLDRTPASRSLIQSFLVTDTFAPAGYAATAAEATEWLQTARARIALVVPQGFERDLARGEAPSVQVLLDGTNSNVAAQARGYALQIVSGFRASPPDAANSTGSLQPMVRVWYNPDQTYTSFMVLSMVTLAALMVGVIYPAASIVREKESGTIEQLRVTPIGTGELFVAKTLPTVVMGLLSVFPSLLIVWWFGVPLRGSLLLFLVLIASATRTLQQALLLSFFGLFPMMFLSGTVAPVESMPDALQTLSLASPLRHYLDITLGVFLKGAGLRELWPQAAALLAIGIPLLSVATALFRRRAV